MTLELGQRPLVFTYKITSDSSTVQRSRIMTALNIFGGLVCLLGLAQWTWKSMLYNGRHRYPDGPRPLAIFGNVSVLKRLQLHPDRELMSIARRWGDICLLWAGRYPMLLINKPQIAKELLVDVRIPIHPSDRSLLTFNREASYTPRGRSPTIFEVLSGHGDCH